MAQSVRITDDQGTRKARKEFLASQVKATEFKHTTPEIPLVSVILPDDYDQMSKVELFGTLQNMQLTTEQAADVAAILDGFPQKGSDKFDIIGIKEKQVAKPFVAPVPLSTTLDVVLPHNYRLSTTSDLYRYLTIEAHLSTDQVNDVLAIMDGKPQLAKNTVYNVTVGEEVIPITLDIPAELPKVSPTIVVPVQLPGDYDQMSGVDLMDHLKVECKVAPEYVQDVMAILEGFPQRSKNVKFDILGIKEKSVPETLIVDITDLVSKVEVELPHDYESYNIKDMHYYLMVKSHLTSDQANDVIDLLHGKVQQSKLNYYNINVAEEFTPLETVAPVVEPKTVEVRVVTVTLPDNYEKLSGVELFTHLRDDQKLPMEHADDVVSILNGFTPRTKGVDYQIEGVKQLQAIESTSKMDPTPQVDIELPDFFTGLSVRDQYTYLTSTIKLTPERANEIIAFVAKKLKDANVFVKVSE